MARLDRLAPIKEVAQIAAVIGREFPHALLAAVADRSESQLETALDQLLRAELLNRRGALPDASYTFKHALVRDAAYASLLRSRRQQLHARVAAALEERSPNTSPELLAQHLTEAGLDERASAAWAEAGRAALSRSAMREAANSLSRAIDLLRRMPTSRDRQRRELELLGWLGVALTNTRGPASPEAQEVHERADQLARELEDREGGFRARWNSGASTTSAPSSTRRSPLAMPSCARRSGTATLITRFRRATPCGLLISFAVTSRRLAITWIGP
jgi:predicted ATPase